MMLTTDDIPTLREHRHAPCDAPEAFWNFKELPTLLLNDASTLRPRRAGDGPPCVRVPALQPEQLRRHQNRATPRRPVRARVQRLGNLDGPPLGPPAQARGIVAAHRTAESIVSRLDRRRQPRDARRNRRPRHRCRHRCSSTRTASIPIAIGPPSMAARFASGSAWAARSWSVSSARSGPGTAPRSWRTRSCKLLEEIRRALAPCGS